MKSPVTWMANNHVTANLLMGFLILSGLFSMMQTKKETHFKLCLFGRFGIYISLCNLCWYCNGPICDRHCS